MARKGVPHTTRQTKPGRKNYLHGYYAFVDIEVNSTSDSEEYIGKEGSAPYNQTDKTRDKEFPEGWTFTAITSS